MTMVLGAVVAVIAAVCAVYCGVGCIMNAFRVVIVVMRELEEERRDDVRDAS